MYVYGYMALEQNYNSSNNNTTTNNDNNDNNNNNFIIIIIIIIIMIMIMIMIIIIIIIIIMMKEGNVLFNDALNTFYLRLYGVRLMVKEFSDSERGLATKVALYASSHRKDNTYHDKKNDDDKDVSNDKRNATTTKTPHLFCFLILEL